MNENPISGDSLTPRRPRLNRRDFLRGVGACLALPALESLVKPGALAASPQAAGALAATPTGAPLRTAFVYVPNGAIQDAWSPTRAGKAFQFAQTMAPLERLKQHVQVCAGLDQVNATAGPDGPGDHARAGGCFLTSVRLKKTAGSDIH